MSTWKPKQPCVYILASKRDGVLYIGVTSAIFERMLQHRSEQTESFTKRYRVHDLVYCEFHDTLEAAITRETRLKKSQRAWKVRLIQETNPEWEDLFDAEIGVRQAPVDTQMRR